MMKKSVSLIVNGASVAASREHLEWTLVRYLREVLGLTGARQSCDGQDTCGACTVIVDGWAKESCRLVMSEMDGSEVETIESLQVEDGQMPHPLIRTVIQDGIYQCGYCAPASILSARAVLDRNPNPSDKEIEKAISPIICRCAGLNGMDESVRRAAAVLRGKLETGWKPADTANEHIVLEKLTGKLKYTNDISFPGMLYGRALRSPLLYARVLKVDVSEAEKMPGVIRVLTSKDVPGKNVYGLLVADQPIFCDEVVRYAGDALAMVIAETQEQSEAALEKIEVELDPLPIITSPEEPCYLTRRCCTPTSPSSIPRPQTCWRTIKYAKVI